ncbi:hypothetical protein [Chengkuizengella marina]|uniref:Uncharacterized protein n=1 Tax=Chengkuizengella marina TaxID=2507566 RepID=A0A6N9Q4Z0_9BACL|nr:hypothetical protein [Chengkuizengella marina]NBI29906.1 hypothetical protein [Chengkuizengella marina]
MRRLNNRKSIDSQFNIPKLELEKFKFSPPGPMGWSFAEYEKMLENHEKIVLNESAVEENLANLEGKRLQEYPSEGLVSQDTNESLEGVGVEETLQSMKTEKVIDDSAPAKSEDVNLDNLTESLDENTLEEKEVKRIDLIDGEEADEHKMYSGRGTKTNLLKIINDQQPAKETVDESKQEQAEKQVDNQESEQVKEKPVKEKESNEKHSNEKHSNEKQTKQLNKKEKKSNKVIVPNNLSAAPWLLNPINKTKNTKRKKKK